MSEQKKISFATITLAPAIDCTVDLDRPFTDGAIHHIVDEICRAGGKGVNVARLLVKRGCSVTAGGLLGQDNSSAYERLLSVDGIPDRFIRIHGETRRNLMILQDGHEFKINREAYPDLRFDDAVLRTAIVGIVAGADIVILGGSLPKQFPADTYARLTRIMKAMGKLVVVDAAGDPLKCVIEAKPTLCKPNRSECEQLLGRRLEKPDDFKSACDELRKKVEAVIITDGANGAWFSVGDKFIHTTAPNVQAKDTTSAGDMLLGEFCAGFFPEMKLTEELAARATACASATISGMGSRCPSPEEVSELMNRVIVSSC